MKEMGIFMILLQKICMKLLFLQKYGLSWASAEDFMVLKHFHAHVVL